MSKYFVRVAEGMRLLSTLAKVKLAFASTGTLVWNL